MKRKIKKYPCEKDILAKDSYIYIHYMQKLIKSNNVTL